VQGNQCRGGSGVETASMQLLGQITSAIPLAGLLVILVYRLISPGFRATVQEARPAAMFAWAAAYLGLFLGAVVVIALILLMLGRAMSGEIPQPRATVMVMATWKPTVEELTDLRALGGQRAVWRASMLDADNLNQM
jgi:hypothetical protein